MIELLPQLTGTALLALSAAAALLVLVSDWRVTLAALGTVYLGAAVLTTQLVLLDVGVVRLITGALTVSILSLTSLQVHRAGEPNLGVEGAWRRIDLPTGLPFRIMAALLAIVVANYLAGERSLMLPGLEGVPAANSAAYILLVFGLLNLGLTEEPMNTGCALLTLLVGFQLMYAAVEPSLAIIALLAAAELGIALAVSYLLVQQYRVASESPDL
jgi:hypothetical protein